MGSLGCRTVSWIWMSAHQGNVLEHLAEPSALLREVRRVTVFGDRVLVGIPGRCQL